MPFGNLDGANVDTAPFSRRADRQTLFPFDGNLRARILSGAILAPPVIAAAIWGGPVFDLLMFLFTAAGLREWLRMVCPGTRLSMLLFAHAALFASLLLSWEFETWLALGFVAVATIALYALGRTHRAAHPALTAFGLPYLACSLLALSWLRSEDPHGWRDLLFVLLVVWASDIGGFLFGKLLGGPLLWPRVSPKKTWAGVFGGLLLAALVATIWALFLRLPAGPAAALALPLAVIGLGGDLFESWVKRQHGQKDSGGLIPGHGGVLDRIDALLAAIPAFALLTVVFGRLAGWG